MSCWLIPIFTTIIKKRRFLYLLLFIIYTLEEFIGGVTAGTAVLKLHAVRQVFFARGACVDQD
jgi:hypothetical protein